MKHDVYGIRTEVRHRKNNSMDMQAVDPKRTKHTVHPAVRIDMTPMVDLGFLLITFFIFTTTISEPTTIKLYMPRDGDPLPIGDSKVLTVLLGNNNRVYAYEGSFEKTLKENKLISTNYDEAGGIGNLIRQKQMRFLQLNPANDKADLLYLIKPTRHCTYKNVIDALDEATINGVKKYMIADASGDENQVFRE